MTDTPTAVRAPVGWADFGVRCPGCGHLNTTGEDWDSIALADTILALLSASDGAGTEGGVG